MSQNNLGVTITADVSKLQAGMVLAQSSAREYSKEMNKLAATHRDVADDAKDGIELQIRVIAQQFLEAKSAAAAYQTQMARAFADADKLREAANGAKTLGEALAKNRAAAMELEHSPRAMADSLVAGINPVRLAAMEMPRLVQAMTELNGISLAAVAGWGGLALAVAGAVGTLGYFAFEARNAGEAARLLDASFTARNISASKEELAEWIKLLRQVADLSVEDAEKVIKSFAGIRGASSEIITALIDMVPQLSKALGEDTPAAAEKLSHALADLSGEGEKFLREIGASDTTVNEFNDALQSNRAGAFKIMLSEISATATRYTAATKDATIASRSFMEALATSQAGPGADGVDKLIDAAHIEDQATRASASVDKLSEALAKAGEIKGGASLESVRAQISALRTDTDKTSEQILDIETKTWRERIAVGDLSGKELLSAQTALQEAETAQRRAGGTAVIEDTRMSIERMKATMTEGGAATLAAEAQKWQALLASQRLTADQRIEVERDVAAIEVQIAKATSDEHKKAISDWFENFQVGIKQQITAAQGNFAEQTRLATEWLATAKSIYGDDVKNYREALSEKDTLDRQHNEELKKEAEQQAEITRIRMQGDAERAKITEKPSKLMSGDMGLGDLFGSGGLQAQVQQEVTKITAAFQQGQAELVQAMSQENDQTKFTSLFEQYKTAQVKYAADIQAVQTQASTAVENAWKKALAPIDQVFSSTINGMIMGTQSMDQALKKMASSILQSFIQSGAHELTAWIAKEAAKTTATLTGNTIRTASNVTAASASGAADTDATKSGIFKHAASAAAAVYDDVSQIEGIGWLLAPPAAAAAFVAVSAFGDDIPSYDVGSWNLPSDTLAQVHKGEMIVPAAQAPKFRDMLSPSFNMPSFAPPAGLNMMAGIEEAMQSRGAASFSGGGGIGDTHHHWNPTIHINGADKPEMTADAVMTALGQGFRNGRHLGDPRLKKLFR